MKKITMLMLLAAMLLPMTMNAEVKTYGQMNKKADKVVVSSTPTAVKAMKTVKIRAAAPKAEVPEGYASVTLTVGDVWEDGSGYQMLLDADANAYGNIFPESGALSSSGDVSATVYDEFEYKIPENADGALSTTNIVINNSITILIPAGVYDYCITNPTPGDRMWIASSYGSAGGRANDIEFKSGVGYTFTVSLGSNGNDQTDLEIDDPAAPVLPTDVVVTPTATTGEVTWVAGENNATWDLRWRPYVDPDMQPRLWDLNSDDQLDGWMIFDADQDGYSWGYSYLDDPSDCFFYSASYANYTDLTPDNWLFTPEVKLGGTLKFDTWNYSSNYPDRIMVYVCDNPDWESVDEFVAISDFIQPGEDPETIELDLSEYEGTGVIAFRHYNSDANYYIFLDNISVDFPGSVMPGEWTVVENATNPYTIEGLTPETEYEVQVMAYNEEGDKQTDWTESTRFTTLAEGGETGMTEFYLVGTFNEWNQTEEGGRIAFVEEGDTYVATNVALEEGAEFKIITPDGNDGWIWFGGQHETEDFFLVIPDYYHNGTEITLVPNDPKGNFKMEYGPAVYKITLKNPSEVPTTGEGIAPKSLQEPLVMVMEKTTAIETINVDNKVKSGRFNLLGQPVNENYKGIVIENGVKKIQK